jgi:hypothetical protein
VKPSEKMAYPCLKQAVHICNDNILFTSFFHQGIDLERLDVAKGSLAESGCMAPRTLEDDRTHSSAVI